MCNDKNPSCESTLQENGHATPSFWILALGSIGVVYGDIGTSPLYALREAVLAAIKSDGVKSDGVMSEPLILGILSLILWALFFIVTIKYVLVLLNADNNGEGGTLSLMALAQRAMRNHVFFIPILGMIGAALFFGDAIITPAISVLSAVEGLKVITPAFEPYILPLSFIILITLFLVQSSGTAKVAMLFGPITLVWFVAIALMGLLHIGDNPVVLASINPVYAFNFLISHGMIGLVTLGAVFLAVTGAEALYADLGHFGKRPIKYAWLFVVLPALTLNYLGQGAFLLKNPAALENPFFLMCPSWFLFPMVILATAATIIASQAVITGAYSLTRQAIQLGLLPRMEIRFTSEVHAGQIYMPQVNLMLLIGVLVLVALFQSSSSLASAYGIAVTGTMVVTATMAIFVIWRYWRWPLWATLALMLPLLMLDIVFLSANTIKIFEGGWVPLALGGLTVLLMWTWRSGTQTLFTKTRRTEVPLGDLIQSLSIKPPTQVPGTAFFLTSDLESVPTALLHSLKHYKVLHEKNIIMTIKTSDLPVTPPEERLNLKKLTDQFYQLVITFGYMETPNVPKSLIKARKLGLEFDIMKTSFFLSRRTIRTSKVSGLPLLRDKIFIMLARNADGASNYFRLPTDRVVEIGSQITI